MKRIGVNFIVVIVMAIFCLSLVLGNVWHIATPVVTVPGSYAEDYAKKHHLPHGSLPDSFKGKVSLRYENFQYNLIEGNISLEGYEGKSETIVVPEDISGKSVKYIGEHFFENAGSVKDIVLPNSVDAIPNAAVSDITVHVLADSPLIGTLNENGWNVETIHDSDQPNFSLGDIPFEYSETEDGIDLKIYTGDEKIVVIPEAIDGIPVKIVSFDMLGYDIVVFPDTITQIDGKLYENLFSRVFLVEMIFVLLSFLIVLIVLNLRTKELKDENNYVLVGPQIVVSVIYFFIQIGFALFSIYLMPFSWVIVLLVNVILLAGYLVIIFMGGIGKGHANQVSHTIKQRTGCWDEIKKTVKYLPDQVADKEAKKAVTRVAEEIQYSTPPKEDKKRLNHKFYVMADS